MQKDNNMEKNTFIKYNTHKSKTSLYSLGDKHKKVIIHSNPWRALSPGQKGTVKENILSNNVIEILHTSRDRAPGSY